MKVGIGYCNTKNSFEAGKTAAASAIGTGEIDKPGLVLAFCHHQVNAEDFFRGLRSVAGEDVPIVGGSAIGIITNSDLSYQGFPAGIAILQSERLVFKTACAGDLEQDERLAGKRLGEDLSPSTNGKLLLIFYDSVKSPPTAATPLVMNASPLLIQGIEEAIAPSVPILGAGLVGDFEFSPTRQFCGYSVASQKVVGTLFGGDLHHYCRIMHGLTPMDGVYHTITKKQGSFIYEVDGQPVVKLIDDLYGNASWRKQVPVKRLCIGVNHGDKYGPHEEGKYVNRLITGVLPDGKGIVLFEPDLDAGTEILFMLRDSVGMIESARNNCLALMAGIENEGKKPVFGLYIDCAGRTAALSDTLHEEASEIVRIFNQRNIPFLGFYSGVEIAPLLGKSRGLDWTGVLWVIAEG
jgi:hypothetical protein